MAQLIAHRAGQFMPCAFAAVGDVKRARRLGVEQLQCRMGEMFGTGRAAALIVHDAQRVALGREARIVRTKLLPQGAYSQLVRMSR